jgi:hypothetical protein
MTQGKGSEFKPQYHKINKQTNKYKSKKSEVSAYTCNPSYLRGRAEKIMV